MQPFQSLAGDVSIYLGGRKITMSEQQLHNPQIGAVIQQVRRKRMPAACAVKPAWRDAGGHRMLANGIPERLPRHAGLSGGDKNQRTIAAPIKLRPRLAQSNAASTTAPLHPAAPDVPSRLCPSPGPPPGSSRGSQTSRPTSSLTRKPVAYINSSMVRSRKPSWVSTSGASSKPDDLVFTQCLGKSTAQFRALDQGGRVFLNPAFTQQPLVELPETGEITGQRAWTATGLHLRRQEMQQILPGWRPAASTSFLFQMGRKIAPGRSGNFAVCLRSIPVPPRRRREMIRVRDLLLLASPATGQDARRRRSSCR